MCVCACVRLGLYPTLFGSMYAYSPSCVCWEFVWQPHDCFPRVFDSSNPKAHSTGSRHVHYIWVDKNYLFVNKCVDRKVRLLILFQSTLCACVETYDKHSIQFIYVICSFACIIFIFCFGLSHVQLDAELRQFTREALHCIMLTQPKFLIRVSYWF